MDNLQRAEVVCYSGNMLLRVFQATLKFWPNFLQITPLNPVVFEGVACCVIKQVTCKLCQSMMVKVYS